MANEKDEFDRQLHRGLLELGLIFPTTPEDVEIALAAAPKTPLPDSLKELPVHLLEQLDMKLSECVRVIMKTFGLPAESDAIAQAVVEAFPHNKIKLADVKAVLENLAEDGEAHV